jgi:hypothetical protein
MRYLLRFVLAWFPIVMQAQVDSVQTVSARISVETYASHLRGGLERIDEEFTSKTNKYLRNLKKQETRIRAKLFRINPTAASNIFDEAQVIYDKFQTKINSKKEFIASKYNSYLPTLDSMGVSLSFLQQNPNSSFRNQINTKDLELAKEKISQLRSKLENAENLRLFLKERREALTSKLTEFGLLKELKAYNKKVFYYQTQLKHFKEEINEPDKLIRRSLVLLSEIPAFRTFFNKHSELASLFMLPNGNASFDPANFPGLQTTTSIQTLLQQRLPGQVPNAGAGQQLDFASSQLTQLKEKISKLGGNNSDFEMPDFKPNDQTAKSLRERLELGTNFQSQRPNGVFPTTTDLGVSLGYKLKNENVFGVGLSYRMGWGDGFKKIKISHQGVGFRTFLDIKLKGSFFISGGGELNYRSIIQSYGQLQDLDAWQKSALLGVTKKYALSKKHQGNIQLLFDFLYNQQVPRAQPLLFRVGYKM